MIEALGTLLTTSPAWISGGLGTLGTALVAWMAWSFRKQALARKGSAALPSAASATPPPAPGLNALWRSFVRSLPSSVRAAPVTLLLGERRAGKTALLGAVRRGRLVGTSSVLDTRLGLYFGDNQIVQEIAGELLEDARVGSRVEIAALFGASGWQTPLVIVVLNPTLPSWRTAASLNELGQIVRARLDALGAARRRGVRVRICLTHIDQALGSGLAEFVSQLPATENRDNPAPHLPLRPTSYDAAALADCLDELCPYLAYGLQNPGFADVLDLVSRDGPGRQLLSGLAPFLQSLLERKTGIAPPTLDGIFLASVREGAEPALSGDPFVQDPQALADIGTVVRDIDRRRASAACLLAAAGAALLSALFVGHYAQIVVAGQGLGAFVQAASLFGPGQPAWPSPAAGAAEANAGQRVRAVSEVGFPLRGAFPHAKQALVSQLLQQIRSYYLLPAAAKTDPLSRVYAIGLLYASSDDAIGRSIQGNEAAWAARLGLPEQVVGDYVALSPARWSEVPVLPPVAESGIGASLSGWSSFLSRLVAAAASPSLTQEVLESLQRDAEKLSVYVRDAPTTDTLVTLTGQLRRAGLPVDTWFGPTLSPSSGSAWVTLHRSDLVAVLTLLRQTALRDVPDARGKSLAQALADLSQLASASRVSAATQANLAPSASAAAPASAAASASAPTVAPTLPSVYAFQIEGQSFEFNPTLWDTLVLSSRAASYVRGFNADTTHRSPFFAPAKPCSGTLGAALVPNRGPTEVLPCLYTPAVFRAEIATPIAALDSTLDRVQLPRPERDQLSFALVQAARDYGAAYRAALITYYTSYRLVPATPAALAADLTEMLSATSYLTEFLKIVAQNADLGVQEGPYLSPIAASLADFAPIVALMVGTPGKYPNLEKYYLLLAPMQGSLAPALPGPTAASGAPLEERLSPLGKLGLLLVRGGEGSPYAGAQAWIEQQAIPASLRAPFNLPVDLAYQFALGALAQTVQVAYSSEIAPTVNPLLSRFPFERGSDVDASVAEVQAVFGPKGSFASLFLKLIAPVCVDGGGGRWAAKSTPFGPVPVPVDALRVARRASLLATTLWGEDGQPKPVSLTARPLPLPVMEPNRSVTLSSLRAGKTSLFGFNQTPDWQALPIEWAAAETASVSLRSNAIGGGDDRYQAVDAGPSEWSFYRLLRKGQLAGSVISWSFPADSVESRSNTISFGLRSDPWAPFSTPVDAR